MVGLEIALGISEGFEEERREEVSKDGGRM